jgi:hypothetical protein
MKSEQSNKITENIDFDKKSLNEGIIINNKSLSNQDNYGLNGLSKKNSALIFKVHFRQEQKKFAISTDKLKDCFNSNDTFNEDSNKGSDYLKNNFKINYLNDSQSNLRNQKENNNLIEPIFQEDFNNKKDNTIINNKTSRTNFDIKNKKIINKFQVFRFEPKIRKEKLSAKYRGIRKYKPDDIRKKIKSRFHKTIKNIINENLRRAGSKLFFSFLPQVFISTITRDKNNQVLNMTYREIIKKDFINDIGEKKNKNRKSDLSKYQNNLKVLEYLDKNPDISENSGFDLISNMKYSKLLDEYFKSEEFEKDILKLQEENEEEEYIKQYKIKAQNYVSFFSNMPNKKNN